MSKQLTRRDGLTTVIDADDFVERWWTHIPEAFKQQFNDEFYAILEENYNAGHLLGQEAGIELVEDVIAEAKTKFWDEAE